ncbi:hypothetical protein ACB098_03G178400 [Castanea mollissima]
MRCLKGTHHLQTLSLTKRQNILTEQCWAHDMNQRPPFLDILKRLEKIKENLPNDHH